MSHDEFKLQMKELHKRLDKIEEWIQDNFHSEGCYDMGGHDE